MMTPPISMATSKIRSAYSPFCANGFLETFTTRKRNGVGVIVRKAKLSEPNVKKANLCATRKERIKLPNYSDGENSIYHISQFLSHPSGIEAILNSKALQGYQSLDSNFYRMSEWRGLFGEVVLDESYKCILPQIKLLNYEVAPVIDLQVTPTAEHCVVEMISCRFEGSDAVQRQNEHFSASMRNNIKWEAIDSHEFLDVDVRLDLVLEIYTQPFAVLPPSAVEGPGNIMMQALLDKLVPLLLKQLLQDYEEWVSNQRKHLH